MFRRLLACALIVVAVAGLTATLREPALVTAAPGNALNTIRFAEGVTQNLQPIGERIYFDSEVDVVWAVVDFSGIPPGTQLTYILRLNNFDYRFGDLNCCGNLASGRFAFPLQGRGGDELPGGAYRFYVYQGDQEIGQAGFGVRGDSGADNGNTNSNSDNDND